jgi:hypothetical protein
VLCVFWVTISSVDDQSDSVVVSQGSLVLIARFSIGATGVLKGFSYTPRGDRQHVRISVSEADNRSISTPQHSGHTTGGTPSVGHGLMLNRSATIVHCAYMEATVQFQLKRIKITCRNQLLTRAYSPAHQLVVAIDCLDVCACCRTVIKWGVSSERCVFHWRRCYERYISLTVQQDASAFLYIFHICNFLSSLSAVDMSVRTSGYWMGNNTKRRLDTKSSGLWSEVTISIKSTHGLHSHAHLATHPREPHSPLVCAHSLRKGTSD